MLGGGCGFRIKEKAILFMASLYFIIFFVDFEIECVLSIILNIHLTNLNGKAEIRKRKGSAYVLLIIDLN